MLRSKTTRNKRDFPQVVYSNYKHFGGQPPNPGAQPGRVLLQLRTNTTAERAGMLKRPVASS